VAVSLDSAWRKWAWASLEAERLQADIDAALETKLEGPPLTIGRSDYQPDLQGFRIYIETIRDPPAALGLLLGNVINDYRSALDHLAWFIYERGSLAGKVKPSTEEQVAFPIYDTRDDFNRNLPRRLPGARTADRAIVRRYQPYQRGKRMQPRMILARIRDLGRIDKHRIAQPVWLRNQRTELTVVDSVDCIVRRIRVLPTEALEVGTELARVYVRRTGPDPDIAVQGMLGSDVTLDNVLWAKNLALGARTHIAEILARFEPAPPDLLERLSEWSQ
jgi:hypothetical protein